jgi:hypothetical protein
VPASKIPGRAPAGEGPGGPSAPASAPPGPASAVPSGASAPPDAPASPDHEHRPKEEAR